jgi:hypothetical protein
VGPDRDSRVGETTTGPSIDDGGLAPGRRTLTGQNFVDLRGPRMRAVLSRGARSRRTYRWICIMLCLQACSHDRSSASESSSTESIPSVAAVPQDAPLPDAPHDLAGIPVVVALPLSKIEEINYVAFSTDDMFILTSGSRLFRASKHGGEPTRLLEVGWKKSTERLEVPEWNDDPRVAHAMNNAETYDLEKTFSNPQVYGGYVYLHRNGTAEKHYADGAVERVPITGGAEELVQPGFDGTWYAVDGSGLSVEPSDGSLVRIAGGRTTVLAPPITDKMERRWIDDGDALLVVDWTHAGDRSAGTVTRLLKAGGAPRVIAKLAINFNELRSDSADLYSHSGEQIWKVPRKGGKQTVIASFPNPRSEATELGVGDQDVFIEKNRADLFRVSKRGGAVRHVRTLPPESQLLGVDATTVWFSSGRVILGLPIASLDEPRK